MRLEDLCCLFISRCERKHINTSFCSGSAKTNCAAWFFQVRSFCVLVSGMLCTGLATHIPCLSVETMGTGLFLDLKFSSPRSGNDFYETAAKTFEQLIWPSVLVKPCAVALQEGLLSLLLRGLALLTQFGFFSLLIQIPFGFSVPTRSQTKLSRLLLLNPEPFWCFLSSFGNQMNGRKC